MVIITKLNLTSDFRQSEIGVIPKDWNICAISEVASISSGGTPDRGVEAFWNGDIPWVTTTEISFNTIRKTKERITDLGLRSSAAKVLPVGTLLIALYGQGKTRGKVAMLGIEATTNQALSLIHISSHRATRRTVRPG